MDSYEYGAATRASLDQIWDKNIADNPGDDRWVRWKDMLIGYNEKGMCKTFVVSFEGKPVGEGTLLFSPECGAISGRTRLADGEKVANINALRIDKKHEGMGHISRLVKLMEQHARSLGYETLTIGVEAAEARNLEIYLHWGYRAFVDAAVEDKAMVLYYSKPLATGIVYNDTKKDLPCDQLQRLFMRVGWSDASQDEDMMRVFNRPFINSTLVISAWDGGRLVGAVRVLSDKAVRSIIYDLLVEPEYQGMGIGSGLVRRCISHFPDSEWLVQTEAGIAGYYEKLGFKVVGDVFLRKPSKWF